MNLTIVDGAAGTAVKKTNGKSPFIAWKMLAGDALDDELGVYK